LDIIDLLGEQIFSQLQKDLPFYWLQGYYANLIIKSLFCNIWLFFRREKSALLNVVSQAQYIKKFILI